MVILLAVIYTMLTPSQPAEQLYYSDIVDMFRGEEVKSFRIEGSTLLLELREEAADGTPKTVSYDLYDVGLFISQLGALIDEQHEAGIIEDYDYDEGFVAPWWLSMIPYLLIIFGFFALWYYMMSKAGAAAAAARPASAASARPARASAARTRRRSPSRTWPAARRRRPSSKRS